MALFDKQRFDFSAKQRAHVVAGEHRNHSAMANRSFVREREGMERRPGRSAREEMLEERSLSVLRVDATVEVRNPTKPVCVERSFAGDDLDHSVSENGNLSGPPPLLETVERREPCIVLEPVVERPLVQGEPIGIYELVGVEEERHDAADTRN